MVHNRRTTPRFWRVERLNSCLNGSGLTISLDSPTHQELLSLQAEKNELREEKQKLKAEKESLEQQVKLLNARPSFVPQPPLVPSLFPAQGQVAGHKLMVPIVGYPSFPMWQFMPPADVDTSQDADKCPPVA
ncbi:hypothetical protein GW17_00027001 [Ensete ventricosum]|uniref:Uncharacterized protein n=1 Tax=Ensete ventricosum TaxID=4639 RepID=A0A426YC56_ENSVE|nr:hypothetical protein B296_00041484 [Ensete ventricosum]RWW09511.1 hypothetical protein GW17_00027001 [Ensete ventricosum]RZS10384.1 hypothetical protein BHM03_00041613 [Ensete ventricosum]